MTASGSGGGGQEGPIPRGAGLAKAGQREADRQHTGGNLEGGNRTPLPAPVEWEDRATLDAEDSGPRVVAAGPAALPVVLTADELATLLRVNRKTLYEALARGDIPGAKRIGATYRIHRDAVLAWLASSQDRAARSRRNR